MAMLAQALAGRPRFSKHTLNVTGANEFRRLDNTGIVIFFSADNAVQMRTRSAGICRKSRG